MGMRDDIFKKLDCETENEFIAKVYRHKTELGMNNKEIADKLNNILGTSYGESTLRGRGQYFNEGYSIGYEKALSDREENSLIKELEEKKEELIKERMKLQSTKIEYNRNLRKDSRFELFYENIRDAKDRLPLPEFKEIILNEVNNGEYLLSLADIHYGAFFESQNNYYSRDKVKEQFELLLYKLKTLIHKNRIEKITVLELGDTIQGMLRISDVKLNDIPIVDSVVEVSRLIANFLNELSKYVYIDYRHVLASNHSQNRYLGTKANEMPLEDMERIIGNYIKDLVANNPRIDVVLTDKDYDSFELCGQNILSLHGHQVKGINNIIKDYSMLHRKFYDLCFVAHFHGGKQMSVGEGNGNTEIIVCPSFIGSDPYSDNLKLGSKAMCKLFKIEEKMGITESYSIILN